MMLVSSRNTEAGISQWKAESSRRAAIEEATKTIARLERMAKKEGIGRRVSAMLEAASGRLAGPQPGITYAAIERRLCRAMKVTPEAVSGRSRNVPVVALCRQAIMYWAKRRTMLSPREIGARMGGRDHSTIYHGIDAYVAKRAAMGRKLRALPREGVFKGKPK